ncbi:RNase adapter RapZ [Exilibacterium tricleocarpae]|uniref:RNase adapter RapZ n=1 Tax=Exilibacterium tricleocarpae TaxID=2591008 RepID=A0A545TSQ0_9GAMM|nr:RNase adapter RapZ [Exilibacterium tricleocarpae]TQV80171.1 RNase adapter RapZ [Exilibacterium tricleocarpae]
MRLVVISGRSGSGKSTALHVLEDVGFNCVDNLPASLLPALIEEVNQRERAEDLRFAVSIDARNTWSDLQKFPQLIADTRQPGLTVEVLFLDARSPTLIQRFSETRRKHPLSDESTDLREAIATERRLLEPIVDVADLVIDTSNLTLHQLRDLVKTRIVGTDPNGMAVLFESFGFKRGVPVDADLVFDVRCLPNPYWKPQLRSLTGCDSEVIAFLEEHPLVADMQADISAYLNRWLPHFEANNRSYITIAIGCTGGQHRSVYLVEQLGKLFSEQQGNVLVRHRELNQQP